MHDVEGLSGMNEHTATLNIAPLDGAVQKVLAVANIATVPNPSNSNVFVFILALVSVLSFCIVVPSSLASRLDRSHSFLFSSMPAAAKRACPAAI